MSDTLIRMPRLADTLVEGTVGQWLKAVGQDIRVGEPLASIETDKVTTELASPFAGSVLELLVAEGATVPVGTPIARIGAQSQAHASDRSSAAPAASVTEPVVAEVRSPKPTPVAARLLADHGLGATQVAGSARRIRKQDVLRHLENQHTVPLTRMRAAIAEHMLRAKTSIPHGQTVMSADVTDLVAWRERHKAVFQDEEAAGLTFTVLFVAALARALGRSGYPDPAIGVAVALDGGLIVPVLRAVDGSNLGAIARGVQDLAIQARGGRLEPDATQGALMTVSNVGSFGNLSASPIIPMHQMGILGPGLVQRRPLPTPDGGIRPGHACLLTLMFDRRALTDLAADRLLRLTVQLLLELAEDAHGGQHVSHA